MKMGHINCCEIIEYNVGQDELKYYNMGAYLGNDYCESNQARSQDFGT
jgi:hypothetical protein